MPEKQSKLVVISYFRAEEDIIQSSDSDPAIPVRYGESNLTFLDEFIFLFEMCRLFYLILQENQSAEIHLLEGTIMNSKSINAIQYNLNMQFSEMDNQTDRSKLLSNYQTSRGDRSREGRRSYLKVVSKEGKQRSSLIKLTMNSAKNSNKPKSRGKTLRLSKAIEKKPNIQEPDDEEEKCEDGKENFNNQQNIKPETALSSLNADKYSRVKQWMRKNNRQNVETRQPDHNGIKIYFKSKKYPKQTQQQQTERKQIPRNYLIRLEQENALGDDEDHNPFPEY